MSLSKMWFKITTRDHWSREVSTHCISSSWRIQIVEEIFLNPKQNLTSQWEITGQETRSQHIVSHHPEGSELQKNISLSRMKFNITTRNHCSRNKVSTFHHPGGSECTNHSLVNGQWCSLMRSFCAVTRRWQGGEECNGTVTGWWSRLW